MALPATTAMRKAIIGALLADSELISLLGGPYVYHRYVRKLALVPSVTYYDYTAHPHPRMPLRQSSIQIDIWDKSLDAAEVKARRVLSVLDTYQAEADGTTPFSVSTGELNWVCLYFDNELDDIAGEAPEIIRKTLLFRLQAFEVAA